MTTYRRVSGALFLIVGLLQLMRLAFRIPVRIGTVEVPLWASGIAGIVLLALAGWSLRDTARDTARA